MDISINEREAAVKRAMERLGWKPTRDEDGWYRMIVPATDEFGNLETEYFFCVVPQTDNLLVLRLYANELFSGRPDDLVTACDRWNQRSMYPKAVLLSWGEGDTRLLLEWGIRCFDHELPEGLIDNWVDSFATGCSVFLRGRRDLLATTSREAM